MAFKDDFPALGFGVGLRRDHYSHLVEREAGADPRVNWFEAITENFMVRGGRPLEVLAAVRQDRPIVLHGVSMSLGSADPLDQKYLGDLKTLVRRFEPAWISDHLCWTGISGRNLHDLLPLPFTEEAVAHVAGRIAQVQDYLGRPILIENISSYLTFRVSRLKEWDFLAAVAQQADCGILLDVNNIFVNSHNHGFDAIKYLDGVPADRVVQFHIAGHSENDGLLLDTHDHPVCDGVWKLYQEAVKRFGIAAATLLEWDDHIPEFEVLAQIVEQARSHAATALREQSNVASRDSEAVV